MVVKGLTHTKTFFKAAIRMTFVESSTKAGSLSLRALRKQDVFGISSTAGGGELGRLRSSSPSQVQVQRGEAELNLDLTRGT